jgi:hypothetical protein
MVEEKYTPEEIEAWKQPIEGEDGITRYDARTKPHYWIYARGVEVWNRWGEGKLTEDEQKSITENIKKYCGDGRGIPKLYEDISFSNTIWIDVLRFEKAIFTIPVFFRNAIFNEDTDFHWVSFRKEVDFIGAKFKQKANFGFVTFERQADFGDAIFKKIADFRNTTFTKSTFFWRAIFKQDVVFMGAIFIQDIEFCSAKFSKGVEFFEAIFQNKAPAFQGTKIEGYFDFSASNEYFPKFDFAKYQEDANDKFNYAGQVAMQYSLLKSLMKKMEFHDKELFFHGKELEAKSYDKNEPKHLRFLYKKYGEFSDYGQSVWRPVVGLFLTFLIWILFYLIHAMVYNDFPQIETTNFAHSVYTSAHYSLPFLPSDNNFHKLAFELKDICQVAKQNKPYCVGWFGVIKGLQSIISLFWIFLIALGLRNNLRMR